MSGAPLLEREPDVLGDWLLDLPVGLLEGSLRLGRGREIEAPARGEPERPFTREERAVALFILFTFGADLSGGVL